MQIKQDPVSKLWCRGDGAILMPPTSIKFKTFRWTFGTSDRYGYCVVKFHGKFYKVHQMVCRAFHGLAPADKPFVDHINRIRSDNRNSNLHWVSRKENNDNTGRVDESVEKYGVRRCENLKAYGKAYRDAHREKCKVYDVTYYAKMKAQGFTKRRGPNGKWGWHPCIRT